MSTQEQAVPKRRSSRGATANRRSAAQRAAAGAIAEVPATEATAASATGDKKAVAARSTPAAEPAPRKDRAARKEQSAEPRKGVVNVERFEPIRRFTRDTMAEIKKVNWPDQQTTRNLTIVVIAVSAGLGLILGGMDFVLLKIFEALP
ncbi:MAG TPA: preprotein translocase subunit SecE [Thermomicrobiales bacterium]|nr:preprotein translocase subunit SecE [Thermomicrobiales bacterium]